MYKIGVIGDKDSILGFKALGFHVFPATTAAEAERTLRQMVEQEYAVIYITEHTAKGIIHVIDELSGRQFPAVVPIPSAQGTLGIGAQRIKKSIERAVGADIIFNE